MKVSREEAKQERFCQSFLQTMDPLQAARESGVKDPYVTLEDPAVQQKLERARAYVGREIRREDVIRRLAQLCFGRVNDAVRLAFLQPGEEQQLGTLELSAVAELKRGSNGALEVKLVDRIKALQLLHELLGGGEMDISEFYEALEQAGEGAP